MTRLAQDEPQVWVTGDVGSGRTTLGQKLVAACQDVGKHAVFVQLAERDEPDAAIGGFYQLARELPDKAKRSSCWQDWPRFSEAVKTLTESSAGGNWIWVLNVPTSWEKGRIGSDWDAWALRRCRDLLESLSRSKLHIVWLTGRTMPPEALGREERPLSLPRPKKATALFETIDWADYQAAADRLAEAIARDSQVSPVVLRLAVALVRFGGDAKRIAEAVDAAPAANVIHSLCEDLIDTIRRERSDLMAPIRRLLLARTSVDADALESITSIPKEERPLLTDCIGYGSREIRVSPSVRAHLRAKIGVDLEGGDEAHQRLADYYKSADGMRDIADTHGDKTIAWLEKIYHQLQLRDAPELELLPCREMYWARGRYLSLKLRNYEDAARVYERCAARFPEDDYARHYWAFNLAQAGRERKTVETQYRQAIQLFPNHPWWNSRLVTFLVEQGRPRSAQEAWKEALENVDPDGDRLITDPELADHLHYWVAQAWLEAGNSAEATAILRSIPKEVIQRSSRLPGLWQRVLAAAEADALGFAVYPESVPMKQRWVGPRAIEVEPGCKWWPGVVLGANKARVQIGYGERTGSGLASFTIELDGERWRDQTGVSPERAEGFVELAEGEDGGLRVYLAPVTSTPHESKPLPSFPYLDRWRSSTPNL
jgi:tetratricopeptide (TPR) repeat protein